MRKLRLTELKGHVQGPPHHGGSTGKMEAKGTNMHGACILSLLLLVAREMDRVIPI